MKALKDQLKVNYDRQRTLLKKYLDEKISDDILSDECIDLRTEEQQVKKDMAKIDIVSKKEFLRLIFKRIVIKDKKLFEVQLNQPFQNYYEEMRCSKKPTDSLTPGTTRGKGKSYILRPTDAK